MLKTFKTSQISRIDILGQKLDNLDISQSRNLEELVISTKDLNPPLRAIIIWIATVGNYPSKEEVYALLVLLNAPISVFEEWLRKKRRNYIYAGMPETYIELSGERATLFDVSETSASNINSGIQRIVRMTAKELNGSITFVKWHSKFGILTKLEGNDLANILDWKPDERVKLSLIPKFFGKVNPKHQYVSFCSKVPVFGPQLLRVSRLIYARYRMVKNIGIRIPTKKPLEIIFDPGSEILVLELQGLDISIMERVHEQLNAGLFNYTFLVHDTLPLRCPEFFPPGIVGNFSYYLQNLSKSSKLMIMSESEKFHLINALPINHASINPEVSLIHPPAYAERNHDVSNSKAKQRHAQAQILMVGSLEPRKNHAKMIQAIVRASKVLDNLTVVLVYPNMWLSENIVLEIDLAKQAGINVQVHCSISDDELFRYYSESTVLLFCSLEEGLGLPLLEARAASLPAITSNRGFMGTLDALGGVIIVDPLDVRQISNQIVSVLSDYDTWVKLVDGCTNEVGLPWNEYSNQFMTKKLSANE